MSLDLGALFATVDVITTPAERKLSAFMSMMDRFGLQADRASTGVRTLDRQLVSTAGSADKASASTTRLSQSTARAAAADDKAAAAARVRSDAIARMDVVLAGLSGESSRVTQATLREAAAQERAALASGEGNAAFARIASTKAGAIAATDRLAAAERAEAEAAKEGAVASGGLRTGFASTLKMAGELGLVIGGIEIAKKAFEFVMAGKDLTDSLNQVQAASRASDAEMTRVRAAAIGLGKDLTVPGATAVDAADAILDLVKAGIQLPRAMLAARPALLLASATQTDMASTAKVLGDTMDIFAIKGRDAAHAADIIGSATLGASHDLLGFFDEIKQAGPTAQALGINLDQTSAALALLAKHGISASMGGAGLKTMLTSLTKDTPKGAAALRDLGVVAFDTQGKFVGFSSLFDQLHAAQLRFGSDSKDFVHDLNAAFGVRSQSVAALFAKEGSAPYDALLKRLESGDLQKYADEMNRGVGAGFRQLGKEFTSFGIDIYGKVEPAVTAAIDWIGTNLPKAISEAKNVLTPFGHFIGGALADAWHLLAGAVSVVGAVLGPVLHLIEDLKTPLGGIATVALGAWAAFKGVGLIMPMITGLVSAVQKIPEAGALMSARISNVAQDVGLSMGLMQRDAGLTATVMQSEFDKLAIQAQLDAGVITEAEAEIATSSQTAADVVVASGEEASVGWTGLLGPLAAVGVGIGLLVSMFHKSSSASKEASDAAKAYSDALQTGDKGTALDAVVKQLEDNNVPEDLQKISVGLHGSAITGKEFVTAITQGGAPLATLRARLQDVIKSGTSLQPVLVGRVTQLKQEMTPAAKAAADALSHLNIQSATMTKQQAKEVAAYKALGTVAAPIGKVAAKLNLSSAAVQQYGGMLGMAVTKNNNLVNATKSNEAAITGLSKIYATATQAGQALLAAWSQFAQSAGTSADRAALIGATLAANAGDALNFAAQMNGAATSVTQLGTDISSAASQIGKSGITTKSFLDRIVNLKKGTIDYGKSAAAPLISDLQSIQTAAINAAEATYQHNLRLEGGKKAADDAVAGYTGVENSLDSQLQKLGLTSAQAQALTNKYLGVPKNVKTLIEQEGGDSVTSLLTRIGMILAHLAGVPWVVKIDANTSPAATKVATLQTWIDNVHQRWIPTMDVNAAPAIGAVLALQNDLANLRDKTINITTYTQTINRKIAQIYTHPATGGLIRGPGTGTSDSIPAMVSNGEFVVNAAQTAKHRDLLFAINKGVKGFAAGGPVNKLTAANIATASTDASSLHGLIGSLSSSGNDVQAALRKIDADLMSLGVPSQFVYALKATNNAILAEVGARNNAGRALAAANAHLVAVEQGIAKDRSTFYSAVTGTFDITSAGANANGQVSGLGILAEQRQDISRAKLWVAGMHKLAALLPGPYVRELLAKGPDALPEVQALLQLNPAQLGVLRSQAAQLQGLGTASATVGVNRLDAPMLAQAQASAKVWQQRQAQQQAALHKELGYLAQEIRNMKFKIGTTAGQLALIVQSGEKQNAHLNH